MPCTTLPKQVFGELKNGKGAQGGPKKHYKGTLNASLKSFGFDLKSWEPLAQDRPAWRRKSPGRCSPLWEQEKLLCCWRGSSTNLPRKDFWLHLSALHPPWPAACPPQSATFAHGDSFTDYSCIWAKRCQLGIIFWDLFQWPAPQSHFRNSIATLSLWR